MEPQHAEGFDMPQIGQILVSVLVLSLLGVVLVIQPGSSYIPALLTLVGSVIGYWIGGQATKAGAQATNGSLERLLAIVQQQHQDATQAVPIAAIPTIAHATVGPAGPVGPTGATGPQGPQGPAGSAAAMTSGS